MTDKKNTEKPQRSKVPAGKSSAAKGRAAKVSPAQASEAKSSAAKTSAAKTSARPSAGKAATSKTSNGSGRRAKPSSDTVVQPIGGALLASDRLHSRLREGAFIGFAFVCIYAFIALSTYHADDPGWSTTGAGHEGARNTAGLIGAYLSDVFYTLFGYMAFLFPIMLGYRAWLIFRERHHPATFDGFITALRVVGFVLVMLSATGLSHINVVDQAVLPEGAGGVLGTLVGQTCLDALNVTGSRLLLLAVFLFGITLFTGLSWLKLMDDTGRLVLTGYRYTCTYLSQQVEYWQARQQRQAMLRKRQLEEEPPVVMEESRAPAIRPAHAARAAVSKPHPVPVSAPAQSPVPPAALARTQVLASIEPDLGRAVAQQAPPRAMPDIVRPDITKPDIAKPDIARPEIIKPAVTRSEITASEPMMPDNDLPEHRHADAGSRRADSRGVELEALKAELSQAKLALSTDPERPAAVSQPVASTAPERPAAVSQPVASTAPERPAAVSQPVASTAPERPAAVRQPVASTAPERPAAVSQPVASTAPERPAAVSQPVAGTAPERPAAVRQPVASTAPERPAAVSQPVASTAPERPAAVSQPVARAVPERPAVVSQPEVNAAPEHTPPPSQFSESTPPSVRAQVAQKAVPKPMPQEEGLHKEMQTRLFEVSHDGLMPDIDLLNKPDEANKKGFSEEDLQMLSGHLEERLKDFGIQAVVKAVLPGPVITRFEIEPAAGVKVSKITGLAKDLARSLSVVSVRVVEVIPGKSYVGIEIPNEYREMVFLSEVLSSKTYDDARSPLTLALGHDIAGMPIMADLAKMPHLLVAGTTGSGKSVGVNAMLLSILYKAGPDEVRLMMVDPKMLELSVYDGIPHLLTPVITDMNDAASGLRWCVGEMERRYKLMAALGVRNLQGYNRKVKEAAATGAPIPDPLWQPDENLFEVGGGLEPPELEALPFIVVVIDEFADMMMIVGKKVEELIARIAQKARAAGIHLVLATQRPSVDVITGLIKANIPSRIAFQVSSKIDSRTILDQGGADQLLGHGDMLYLPPGTSLPVRVHGAFVDDDEVHRVVNDWKTRAEPNYINDLLEEGANEFVPGYSQPGSSGSEDDAESEPLYDEAVHFVTQSRKASISAVQRKLRIGYNRAARMIETMEEAGVISAMGSNGQREVLAPPPPPPGD